MRLLICGDRNWRDGEMIYDAVLSLDPEAIIHGCANGADFIAGLVAKVLDIPVLEFPANWDLYHKAAGPIRNKQMLEEGKPTHVAVFHDDIGHSKGTADMVRRANKAGIPIMFYCHMSNEL